MVEQRLISRKYILIAVSLFILLAYGLRLINLGAFSFWTDEGLTPLRSGYSIVEILSNRILIQEAISKDTHPPFYYLIIHFTHQLFGETDFAYRYPSLLAGVLLVPLLYQFGRSLQNKRAGLLAALLVAINPLQIYYGNEARMYTILVLLAAGASYVLWRALSGGDLRRNLLLYLVLAGLTFYTHYTAVFLIAAQGIFWLWLLWRAGYKRLLIGVVVLAVLLAIPVIPFTVPRLFTGVETNYYYVQPSIMLHDVIRFFSLGVTFDFAHWSTPLLEIAILILFLIGVWAARPWQKRAFLLVYLLAVVLGLMVGSLLKPMYQGVRHIMTGSPALLLLLAIGADYLFSIQGGRNVAKRWFVRLAAILLFLAPLVGSVHALDNLYNDSHYAKGDFRSLIRYIEARAGERDVVLYHDAILLPMYEHYRTRPDLMATALPVYPYLADGVEAQLSDLADEYDRIWFVPGRPTDGRDTENKVPDWLEQELEAADFKRFRVEDGAAASVIGYRTSPPAADTLPENSQELDLSWGDLPILRGIQLNFSQPAASETLWFDLYWQGEASAPTRDMSLRFRLIDPEGDSWADYTQLLIRDVDDWPESGFVRRSYKLPIPPGTPPGDYTLMAQAFDGFESPLADEQALTELQLAAAQRQSGTPSVLFDNGLMLQDVELFDYEVRPGHTLPFAIQWQAAPGEMPELDGLRYTLDVISPSGEVLRSQGGRPGADWLESWPDDALIRENSGLYFRPDTEPGLYRLRWQMQVEGEPVGGRPYWRPWNSETIEYGTVEVVPWPLNKELPQNTNVVEADFGPAIQLYSYELDQPNADSLEIELYWLAKEVPDHSYVIFVHVIDTRDGRIVSQVDRLPVDGLRPTPGWRSGEVLFDQITLSLPADLLPGDYEINIGFYDPDDGRRLPVSLDGEPQLHNQLTLATITLP
jgi:4-amino-4-deoxy-L-arabinose transferase-like glycosyltransferase